MIHFAYPNAKILPSEFTGCGRYIASEYKPDQYRLPSKIYSKQKVEETAGILAYESFESEKVIYEKKDFRPEPEVYRGESKNLAYLFALISRSRKVKLKIDTDIWCTGSIDTEGNPFLKSVDANVFEVKLGKGFLSEENQDKLFILPEANFLPSHQVLCDQNNISVFSVEQFRQEFAGYGFKIKTVLKVRSDELYALTSLVFETGPNPYKGLEYFDEKDANRFFGRDDVVQEIFNIYQNLCDSSLRFMAILGPSGSGKSSIARAGLIPKIRQNKKDTSVIIFRPGEHPLLSLAKELSNFISKKQFTEKIWKRLNQANIKGEYDGLSAIAEQLSELLSASLLILVDQFEEIYSMCEDKQDRVRFIGNLLYAASDPSGHTSVVIVFRYDFMKHTYSDYDLNSAITHTQKIKFVPAMSPNNIRAAIAEPARRSGYIFDFRLIDELIFQTEGHVGALPLLEFALSGIWQGMENGVSPEASLKDINGVGGALAHKAQELYDRLGEMDKRIIRRTFLRLINIGEGMFDIRRRVPLSEVIAKGEAPDHVRKVLRNFSAPGARLITLSSDSKGNETIEITHEALFEHWGLLKKWIDEYIIDIRFHWKLSEAAKEWEFHNKAEGLLWYQSPNFDKLQDFYERNYLDMMDIQVKFYEKSKIKKEGEEAVRIQREISRAAMNWKVNHKAKDLLWWYSPELDILKKFYKKNHQNMTLLEKEFYEESRKEKENKDVEIILTKIKKRIMEAKNLNEIMIDMIAEIAEVFNSERAIIYIYDREKKELMSRQLIYEKEISEMRTKMTRDQIKWIQDQTACCVSKGILDVPISFQKIFMGVVRFMNKKDGTAYSRIDERAAKELSQHIGIAVNNILKESKINTPPLLHKYSLLIQRNFISIQEINVAMEEWKSKNSKMSFYMYLITKYNIPKKELLESFAKYYNVPYMEYDVDTPIRKDLIKTLGVPFLKMNYWIPLRNQGKKIIIAIDDPEDCIKIEGIKRIFPNRPIEFRISLKEDILDFIRLFTEGKKER